MWCKCFRHCRSYLSLSLLNYDWSGVQVNKLCGVWRRHSPFRLPPTKAELNIKLVFFFLLSEVWRYLWLIQEPIFKALILTLVWIFPKLQIVFFWRLCAFNIEFFPLTLWFRLYNFYKSGQKSIGAALWDLWGQFNYLIVTLCPTVVYKFKTLFILCHTRSLEIRYGDMWFIWFSTSKHVEPEQYYNDLLKSSISQLLHIQCHRFNMMIRGRAIPTAKRVHSQ